MLLDLADATLKPGLEVLSVYNRFVYAAVLPEYKDALYEALHDTVDIVGLSELNEAIGNLMVQYTKRPTAPLSPSRSGSEETGLTPKVVSLSPGTEEKEAALSSAGPQNMH